MSDSERKVKAFGGDPVTIQIVQDLSRKLEGDVERVLLQAIELATDDKESTPSMNIALSLTMTAVMSTLRCFLHAVEAGILIESRDDLPKGFKVPLDIGMLMVRQCYLNRDGLNIATLASKAIEDARLLNEPRKKNTSTRR